MDNWLLIGAAACWLLALVWIVQDVWVNMEPRDLLWWGPLGLLLGPLAIPLYLGQRMTRRAEMRTVGRGSTTTVSVPDKTKPFRSAGIRRMGPAGGPGSGIFVAVTNGVDAPRRAELPPDGELLIRRAVEYEQSRPGVLALHDPAVSRETHCRVALRGERLVLHDSSRYGTRVDGKRVRGGTVDLHIGSRIQIGKTTMVTESAEAAQPRP